jgi:hypothetical protein
MDAVSLIYALLGPERRRLARDGINTDSVAVALHIDYATKVGLGSSTNFPWDIGHSIYFLKEFHDLH